MLISNNKKSSENSDSLFGPHITKFPVLQLLFLREFLTTVIEFILARLQTKSISRCQ